MDNAEKIAQLQKIISGSGNIVFFGGAGVSTESGIPDFRSKDGLYNQKDFPYSPEEMFSHSFFMTHMEEFFDFHRSRMRPPEQEAQPNDAHRKLAELEKAGKLRAVITQNIDGLHQKAGSQVVVELHGNDQRYYCSHCGKLYDREFVRTGSGIPRCDCDGVVRPDVVLYEEALDEDEIRRAVQYIRQADVLIIGGTSLVVWPAAGLVDEFGGSSLVVINKGETHKNRRADLVIDGSIGAVLGQIAVE